eukprot:1860843-Pleurochrysis_carterae.AAC.1
MKRRRQRAKSAADRARDWNKRRPRQTRREKRSDAEAAKEKWQRGTASRTHRCPRAQDSFVIAFSADEHPCSNWSGGDDDGR